MKCKQQIFHDRGGNHRCSNLSITSAGFCRVHDPDCQAERRKKRGPTQFERECAAMDARAERDELKNAVIARARLILADGPMMSVRWIRHGDELLRVLANLDKKP